MIRRTFYLILHLFLPVLAFPQTEKLVEEGDFLFLDLDCGGLCDAIEAVTEGVNGQDFSHLGLVHLKKDSVFVLEAMGNSVQLTSLNQFLSYSKKPAVHARLKPAFRKLIPEAMAFGLEQIGKPYDDAFLPDNEKYYCSELVYDAFRKANAGQDFFALEPMTFRQPGSKDFFPVWVEYYRKLGVSIPETVPGCNPGGISRSPFLNITGDFSITNPPKK